MKLIMQTPMVLVIDGMVQLPVSEMRNEELKSLFHYGTDLPVPERSFYFLYSDEEPSITPGSWMHLDFPEEKRRWHVSFVRCHPVGHCFETRVKFLRETPLD